MKDLVLHLLSMGAAATVFFVSSLALKRMGEHTARMIVWSYVSLFAGSGGAFMISGWELVSGGRAEGAMHLAMLIVIAGLSVLLLASRRRECLCPDCPARRKEGCHDCVQRGTE